MLVVVQDANRYGDNLGTYRASKMALAEQPQWHSDTVRDAL